MKNLMELHAYTFERPVQINGPSPTKGLSLKMDLKMAFHLKWKSKYTLPWKIRPSF